MFALAQQAIVGRISDIATRVDTENFKWAEAAKLENQIHSSPIALLGS
jgi:hypothetical protein